MYPEALAEYEKLGVRPGSPGLGLSNEHSGVGHPPGLASFYAASGRREEALKVVRKLEDLWRENHGSAFGIALVYAQLGVKDKSLYWLNKAYQQRLPLMVTLKVHPDFDPLRSDPRFQDLLRRMNFPP